MVDGIGEDMPANAGAGLLGSCVVNLLEYAGHTEQVRRLEATQIGQQMLGVGHIAHHPITSDGHILDVTREAMASGRNSSRRFGASYSISGRIS